MNTAHSPNGRWLARHPILTFLIMICAALVFGLSSFNLFFLLRANVELVADHGMMALMDGALMQLIGLLGLGFVSLCSYLVLKCCERTLVDKFTL